MGYLSWAPNVTGEKKLSTFAPAGDQAKAAWAEIRHFTTSLYKPAVQVLINYALPNFKGIKRRYYGVKG